MLSDKLGKPDASLTKIVCPPEKFVESAEKLDVVDISKFESAEAVPAIVNKLNISAKKGRILNFIRLLLSLAARRKISILQNFYGKSFSDLLRPVKFGYSPLGNLRDAKIFNINFNRSVGFIS